MNTKNILTIKCRKLYIKISCPNCILSMMELINEMKDKLKCHFDDLKEKLQVNYENLEIANKLDELNYKILQLRDNLIEKLDSKDMEWIDFYQKQINPVPHLR